MEVKEQDWICWKFIFRYRQFFDWKKASRLFGYHYWTLFSSTDEGQVLSDHVTLHDCLRHIIWLRWNKLKHESKKNNRIYPQFVSQSILKSTERIPDPEHWECRQFFKNPGNPWNALIFNSTTRFIWNSFYELEDDYKIPLPGWLTLQDEISSSRCRCTCKTNFGFGQLRKCRTFWNTDLWKYMSGYQA